MYNTSRVVTYQLAYLTKTEVELCADCAARGPSYHLRGQLGPVSHGAHDGACKGERHGGSKVAVTR